MDIYTRLGIEPVLNAASSLTKLGGNTLPEPVLAAMWQASRRLVDMEQLASRVGAELARLTRNEAACVTASGAAGLALGVLAFRTHGQPKLIARLPRHPSLQSEIIMFCAHRNPYDRAVRLAGATIRQVGNAKQTFDYELEAAIGPDTAGILYVAGPDYHRGSLSLTDTVRIASRHGIPVLVDAAAQLPPVNNLWRYTSELGADLAVFSGGKQLRGPQASGLVVGNTQAIEGVRANAAPHQRFARAMKAGKEEMAGLLAAVELFVADDHIARFDALMSTCQAWAQTLADHPHVTAVVESRNAGGAQLPRLKVAVNQGTVDARAVERVLWDSQPRIAVLVFDSATIYLEPEQLSVEEADTVIDRLLEILAERVSLEGEPR